MSILILTYRHRFLNYITILQAKRIDPDLWKNASQISEAISQSAKFHIDWLSPMPHNLYKFAILKRI